MLYRLSGTRNEKQGFGRELNSLPRYFEFECPMYLMGRITRHRQSRSYLLYAGSHRWGPRLRTIMLPIHWWLIQEASDGVGPVSYTFRRSHRRYNTAVSPCWKNGTAIIQEAASLRSKYRWDRWLNEVVKLFSTSRGYISL